jgi:Pyruvate/2-oxoacid:ferredoxin oxidoreductase gamma subunit
VDPHFVHRRDDLNSRCIELPMHASISVTQNGAQNLNLCMLGALTGLIDFVSTASLAEAVRLRFRSRGADAAIEAVQLGRSLVLKSVEVF